MNLNLNIYLTHLYECKQYLHHKNMICYKCNKEFKTKQAYDRHMNRKTSCVKEIIQCDNCLQVFKRKEILNKHLNRKFKCEKVDLKMEIIELKHQLEIEKLKQRPTYINNINNINNNIILNNFGDEEVGKIKYNLIRDGIDKILNNKLLLKPANYKVGDFEYTNEDIKDIDILRLLVKLIFNNKNLPQNKTLIYDDVDENFLYYINDEWVPFDTNSNKMLIDIIYEKLQKIIVDKRFYLEHIIKELTNYVGSKYNVNINVINENDPDLLINDYNKKVKYDKLLVLEYKKKFGIHQINEYVE